MPQFVIQLAFTDSGREQLGSLSAGRDAFRDLVGDGDVELRAVLLTMGRYDDDAIVEAADAETFADLFLEYAEQGIARTETLRAFPAEEYLYGCSACSDLLTVSSATNVRSQSNIPVER